LAKPTEGNINILGNDIRNNRDYLKDVGFLPDVPSFYNWMTAREYMRFSGELFDMKPKQIKEKTDELLKLVDLEDNRKIGGYSRGMKQRLGLAQALINDPKLIFMDEPTSALDPIGRKEVLDLIEQIKHKATIFFSTHILSDVERVCNRVGIMNKGKLITDKNINDLKAEYGESIVEIELVSVNDALVNKLENADWVKRIIRNENKLIINVLNSDKAHYQIPEILSETQSGVISLNKKQPNLEDIFVKLVNSNEN
jgi:ABC-2 type transport system ATP-binding protein